MEAGELTRLQLVNEERDTRSDLLPDEDEADHRPRMIERPLKGKTLGRQLRQTAKTVSTADTPIRVEPIDGSLEAKKIMPPGLRGRECGGND